MRPITHFEFVHLNGFNVYGGPFHAAPHEFYFKTLCLQAEPRARGAPKPDQFLRIPDFSVPEVRNATFMLAWVLFESIVRKRPVYVGCMGGTGRTGLILALLIKICYGETTNPLVNVRAQYRSSAVETQEQEEFLSDFPVRNLKLWLKICKLIASLH